MAAVRPILLLHQDWLFYANSLHNSFYLLLIRVCDCFSLLFLGWWVLPEIGVPSLSFNCWKIVTSRSFGCHRFHFYDSFYFWLFFSYFLLHVVDLFDNAVGKFSFLFLNHFTSHRAEVKEREDVDFEDLVVRELLHGIMELCLLATKISPQWVLHLADEVLRLESFLWCGVGFRIFDGVLICRTSLWRWIDWWTVRHKQVWLFYLFNGRVSFSCLRSFQRSKWTILRTVVWGLANVPIRKT